MTHADGLQGEAFNGPPSQPPTHPELLGQAAAAGYVDQLVERSTPDLGEVGLAGGEAAYPPPDRPAAAGPFMEEMMPSEPNSLSLDEAPITPDKPEDKPAQPSITSQIREVAARAVESFLADVPVSNRHQVTIGKLARLAFDGEKIPKKQFRMFESAIKQDPRLEYQPGKRRFAAKGFDDSASAAPDTETNPSPPEHKVTARPASRKKLDQMLVELRRDPDISEAVTEAKSQQHRMWRHSRNKAKSRAKWSRGSPAKKRP